MKKTIALSIGFILCTLQVNSQTIYIPNGANGIGQSSNGNVGIGTTNPKAKLQVEGNVHVFGQIGQNLEDAFSYDGQRIGFYSMGWVNDSWFSYGPTFWQSAYGGVKFFTAGQPRLSIVHSGNVGIGTTTPDQKLTVNGNAKVSGTLFTNEIHFYGADGTDNSDPYTLRKVHDSDNKSHLDLNLNDDSDESFRIYGYSCNGYACGTYSGNLYHSFDALGNVYHAGNVGIGTTTPDQKLTVKGKIHAEEVILDLNVPLADYVFSKNYKLMPLSEVEQFVQENSHLPEMPTAEQVKDTGLSMGEMQNKMLQKIEELTLYIIEQDKRIRTLEDENKRLKK